MGISDGAMTQEQGREFMTLLYARDPERILMFLDDHQVAPAYVVSLLAHMCAEVMPLVTGDSRSHSGDMWIIESGDPAAQASPAMRIVVACANDDPEMIQAHLAVIMDDHGLAQRTIVELLRMTADLMKLATGADD